MLFFRWEVFLLKNSGEIDFFFLNLRRFTVLVVNITTRQLCSKPCPLHLAQFCHVMEFSGLETKINQRISNIISDQEFWILYQLNQWNNSSWKLAGIQCVTNLIILTCVCFFNIQYDLVITVFGAPGILPGVIAISESWKQILNSKRVSQ